MEIILQIISQREIEGNKNEDGLEKIDIMIISQREIEGNKN